MEQKEGRTGGRQRMQEVEHEVTCASREVMAWVCVVWSRRREQKRVHGVESIGLMGIRLGWGRMALGMTSRSQPRMAIRLSCLVLQDSCMGYMSLAW